ncbi:MAG: hypothetical protein Q4F95_01070 [Oscillospiraceae bacterium]|nr:hypothetical protein [Oscillospiraceae bacterium]
MVAVKVWYKCENDITQSRITIDGIEFDTDRIKDKKIEIWTSPFFIDGVKWNGFYAEMIKSIKSSDFTVEFHGSDDSYMVIKKALDNHYISISKYAGAEPAAGYQTPPNDFRILSGSIHIDPRFCIYVKLKNKFMSMAHELSAEFVQVYEKRIRNIGDFACDAMTIYNKVMECAFDRSISIIINTTAETRLDKAALMNGYLYTSSSYKNMYNSMCSAMALEEASAEAQNDPQNQQPDKKNNINFRYRIMNFRKFKDICRCDKLAACVYNDIAGVYYYLCLNTRLGEIIIDPRQARENEYKAYEIFRSIESLTQEDEIRDSFIKVFRLYPYNIDYFTGYLKRYCDPDGELARMAAFMSIDISQVTEKLINQKFQNESFDTYEKAVSLRDRIIKEMDKYSVSTCSVLAQVNQKMDILGRTYKGIVYETPQLRNKALGQDTELSGLCSELDTMDHDACTELKKQIAEKKYTEHIADEYIKQIDIHMNRCECEILDKLVENIENADNTQLYEIRKQITSMSQQHSFQSAVSKRYLAMVTKAIDKNSQQQIISGMTDISHKNSEELDEIIKFIDQIDCSQDIREKYISTVNGYKRAILAGKYSQKLRKVIDSCSDFISIVNCDNEEYIKTEAYLSEYISKYGFSADEPVIAYIVLSNMPRVIYTNKRIVSISADRSVLTDEFIVCEIKKKVFSNQIYFSMKQTQDCFSFDIVNNRYADGLCWFTNLFVQIIQDKNKVLDEMCRDLDTPGFNELLQIKHSICVSQCSTILKDIYLAKADAAIEDRREKSRRSYLNGLRDSVGKMNYEQMCQKISGIRNHTDKEYLRCKSFVTEGEALSIVLSVKTAEDEKKLSQMFANVEKAGLDELVTLKNELSSSNFMKSVSDRYENYLDKRISYVQTQIRNKTLIEIKNRLAEIKYEDIYVKLRNVRNETDEDYLRYSAYISKDEFTMMLIELKASIEDNMLSQMCNDLSSLGYDELKELRQKISDSQFIEKTAAPYLNRIDMVIGNVRKENHDKYINTLYEQISNMDHKQLVSTIHAIMQSKDSIFEECVPKAEAVAIVTRKKAQHETNELESMFERFGYMSTKEIGKLYKNLQNIESMHTFDPETVKPYLRKIEKELRIRDKKGRKKGYTVCPNCGVPARTGSPFCGACGARIEE